MGHQQFASPLQTSKPTSLESRTYSTIQHGHARKQPISFLASETAAASGGRSAFRKHLEPDLATPVWKTGQLQTQRWHVSTHSRNWIIGHCQKGLLSWGIYRRNFTRSPQREAKLFPQALPSFKARTSAPPQAHTPKHARSSLICARDVG